MARFCLVTILVVSLGGCAADDVGGGAIEASILMSMGEGVVDQGYDEGNQIPKKTSVAADTSHWATDYALPARIYDFREELDESRIADEDLSIFDVTPVSRSGSNLMARLHPSAEEHIAPSKTPVVTAVPSPPKLPVSKGVTENSYLIQLGALPSEESARREWVRIEMRHPDFVRNRIPTIVPVELDPQMGKVFRLRTGPISEIKLARSLCRQLKNQGQDCFVVKIENPI